MSPDEVDKLPAIIFDFGGVLIDWNPKHLYSKMFNGDEEQMEYFLSVVCPLEWNEQMDAGRPFAEAVEERSQLFPEYEPYIRAYQSRWIEMVQGEFSGTVEILSALREEHYPLYALSNWSAETFPLVHRQYEFLNWFKAIILSGQVKLAKPDPAIFDLMLQLVNRPAGQCLFIDDNERNIITAIQLGFQTIHFTTPELLYTQLAEREIFLSNGEARIANVPTSSRG